MEFLTILANNAQTPTGGVFILCCLILISYVSIIRKMNDDSPFKEHIVIITGACILVPAILFLKVTGNIGAEAMTGFLGTIVGYFFQTKK